MKSCWMPFIIAGLAACQPSPPTTPLEPAAASAAGAPAAAPPAAPAKPHKGDLIDDDTYRFAEGSASRRAYSAGPFAIQRGSLDADLVVAILRDRAQKLAARAVQDALTEAKVGATQAVGDMVTAALDLVTDPAGLQRQHVETLARVVVRAALAEVVVRTAFPGAEEWKTSKRWADLGAFRPTDADVPILTRYLTMWTYWYLGSHVSWLGSTAAGMAPACPAAPATKDQEPNVYPICNKPEDVARLLKLREISQAIEFAAGLANGTQVSVDDLTTLALAAARLAETDAVAKLDPSGIDIESMLAHLTEAHGTWTALKGLIAVLHDLSGKTGAGQAKAADVTRALSYLCEDAPTCQKQSPLAGTFRSLLPVPAQFDVLFGWLQGVAAGKQDAAPMGATAVLNRAMDMSRDLGIAMANLSTLTTELKGLTVLFGPDRKVDKLAPSAAKSHLVPLLQKLDSALRQAVIDFASFLPDEKGRLASVQLTLSKLARLREVLRVITSADTDAVDIRSLVDSLATLAAADGASAPMLSLLTAVIREIPRDGKLDLAGLIKICARVPLDNVIRGLGLDGSASSLCSDTKQKQCWPVKIVQILQESTSIEEKRITVDGQRLAGLVSSFGDDLSRKTQGRWFFHLTVGLGELFVVNPAVVRSLSVPGSSAGIPYVTDGPATWTPVISEQIGFGYALPTWLGGRVTMKAGFFASGLLYRLLLDSKESDSIIVGGFVAADLYETVELYAAVPSILFYPPEAHGNVHVGAGLSFGAQVPLGDYLSALK